VRVTEEKETLPPIRRLEKKERTFFGGKEGDAKGEKWEDVVGEGNRPYLFGARLESSRNAALRRKGEWGLPEKLGRVLSTQGKPLICPFCREEGVRAEEGSLREIRVRRRWKENESLCIDYGQLKRRGLPAKKERSSEKEAGCPVFISSRL